MRTAESIEQQAERNAKGAAKKKYKRGQNPNSHTAVGKRNSDQPHLQLNHWRPGQSGNPGGRPKNDVAKEIARAIFENNRPQLYQAYGKAALKGNAYAFKELADRAYGKLKERVEYDLTEYREVSEQAIIERIRELEAKLGVAAAPQLSGRTGEPAKCSGQEAPAPED